MSVDLLISLEKLWNDIQLIYEHFNFSNKTLMDDLMIVSSDNCYFIYYTPDCEPLVQIKIEKDYNLVRMWGGDVPYDVTNYKINVGMNEQLYTSEKSMIEAAYKVITPFLREVKLKQIGV